MRRFADLNEREILALAISSEEDDARTYAGFANRLMDKSPSSAKVFLDMAEEEHQHRQKLTELYRKKFGEYIPLIRRSEVAGFVRQQPLWQVRTLGLDAMRKHAEVMELEAQMFYSRSAERATDKAVTKLLNELAEAEKGHEDLAARLGEMHLTAENRLEEDDASRRLFLMQVIQPGLLGLMDGSVSTLAPLFAAAFATQNTWSTFLVGVAASIGAGISMGFAEALSDDGALTGRGHPLIRGSAAGLMTAIGGLGHTMPFLITDFITATIVSAIVVFVELAVISWVRHRYMDTPLMRAAFQVAAGGFLVFLAGILIGNA